MTKTDSKQITNSISELEKLQLRDRWQIIDHKMEHWAGYLKTDPTLFAYFFFRDIHGNKFKCRDYQDKFLNDTSKRKCVCIARQMGKSTMAAIQAFHRCYFYPNTTVVAISATKAQAVELVKRIKDLMRGSQFTDFKELLPSQKESRSEIVLKSHDGVSESRIISVPATDAARGYSANMVIVDEAAFIENGNYIFNSVIEPMTTATKGTIILLSTPNGRQGFFYDCFISPNWSSYQFDWKVNAELTQEEMDAKRDTKTPMEFASEYEAKFLSPKSAYFTGESIQRAISNKAGLGAKPHSPLAIGVDFGKIRDHCVIDIGIITNPDAEPKDYRIRLVERIEKPLGTDYADIISELKYLGKILNPTMMVLDATGVGEAPCDMLSKEAGINILPIKFSRQSKLDLYGNLNILFEQGRIEIPNEKKMIAQLEIFSYKYSDAGNMLLAAPDGEHDDECDALALMVWGLTRAINPPVTLKIF